MVYATIPRDARIIPVGHFIYTIVRPYLARFQLKLLNDLAAARSAGGNLAMAMYCLEWLEEVAGYAPLPTSADIELFVAERLRLE